MVVMHIYLLNLIFAFLVFGVGRKSVSCFPGLTKLNLPVAFIGGLAVLPFVKITESLVLKNLTLSTELRDILLVIFFCSLGLGIQFKEAAKGGKPLVIITSLAILLVLLQNICSVIITTLFDLHPAYGLLSGSVSYVGGFGSSLAWGTYYAELGLPNALEVGFSSSMLGLLCGGLFAGPTVAWILKANNLKANSTISDGELQTPGSELADQRGPNRRATLWQIIKTVLFLTASIIIGDYLKTLLGDYGINLPRFLSAMLVAIVLVNIAGLFKIVVDDRISDLISEISLNVFIILSLFTISLQGLSDFALPLLIILLAQIVLTVLFASQIVFRIMGKDYEAAVLSGGVIGFGLSSLAVAMATVRTITNNYGPAPKAVLLTSLVGAALIDLPNNLLIGLLTRISLFVYP